MVANIGKNMSKKNNKTIRLWWQSSYDRGLVYLLRMWPRIKEVYPNAEFHCTYGWDFYDSVYSDNPERQAWKAEINKMMEQPGITHYGRVGKKKLQELRKQCDIWAYPTDFCVAGDTLVDIPRDYIKYPAGVPIKELVGKKGIYVWTMNEDTGDFELKKAKWIKKTREKADVIKINWDDGTSLKLTPDHLVMTYKRGWVQAKDLEIGEKATWGDNGRKTQWNHKVLSIEDAGLEDVYDMLVEDNHNFIAGGVVVHNCEINCIGALESQYDGCVPCVINYAALKETVQSGVKVNCEIADKECQEEYLQALLELMGDDKKLEEERKKGREFAKQFTWDRLSAQWVDVFQS